MFLKSAAIQSRIRLFGRCKLKIESKRGLKADAVFVFHVTSSQVAVEQGFPVFRHLNCSELQSFEIILILLVVQNFNIALKKAV